MFELLSHSYIEFDLNNYCKRGYKTMNMSFVIFEREAYLSRDHQKQKRKIWRNKFANFPILNGKGQ